MFNAIFLKNPDQEQAEAFYALLDGEPGRVTEEELTAARAAMEQLNQRNEEDRAYRDASVVLSLFVLYGGGTDAFDREGYGRACAVLFPGRDGVEAAASCARAVAELKTVYYQELPERYKELKAAGESMEGWKPVLLMAKRAFLDVMLRMQDFNLVKDTVQELSGEMLAMDAGLRESVTALRNEFGEFRGGRTV